MFSSFFGKSKPINILIVAFLISLVFLFAKFEHLTTNFNLYELLKNLGLLLVAIFSVFVLDFIIGKNNLTKKNSYAILLFGLFIVLIPQSINQTNVLFSNLFILLALRRIMSMHSKLEVKKKLVDAAFWVGIASLFYFWSILFFILILIALMYYSQNDIKNWIIPFIGLLVVILLVISFNILTYNSYWTQEAIYPGIGFDWDTLNTYKTITKLSVILSLFVIMFIPFIRITREKINNLKPAYILIGIASIIAVVITILAPIKTGAEFIFLFGPLAIITTSYLEKVKKTWIREVIISSLVVIPLILLVL